MANKIKYGLRNVYYATVTAGVYGTPVAMPGAKAISLMWVIPTATSVK